jgi:glycosyltransferase involved in cell wall biosynthesis
MQPKVLVIIPAFNEESTIVEVIEGLSKGCPDYDLLVINDASFDRTSEFARSTRKAMVVDLPVNLGIGGAVQTGLKYAGRKGYDCAVQFDADGQHKADDLPMLANLVLTDECDIAIGSRFVGDHSVEKSDWLRRFGIMIFEFFSLILIRKRIRDHTSGFRAFNKATINFIMHRYPVDYPEPEIIVLLSRNNFRIKEVFTQMYSRQGGVSSIPYYRGPYYMVKVMISMFMARIRPKEFEVS